MMHTDEIKRVNNRAVHGAWVTGMSFLPGISFKVRAVGSPEYHRKLSELLGNLTGKARDDALKSDETLLTIYVETVLVDWDGIENDDGPVPFSPETAREMLQDPEYMIFFQAIKYAATVVAEDGRETLAIDTKNSLTGSVGSLNGAGTRTGSIN